jgi:glutathione transport system permease protein
MPLLISSIPGSGTIEQDVRMARLQSLQVYSRERLQSIKQAWQSPTQRHRALVFLQQRWLGIIGLLLLLAIIIPIVFAPWVTPVDPNHQDLRHALEGPQLNHWLGTDELGRDVFSRILYGGRVSLLIALGSVALGLLVGGLAGCAAGYRGGWLDSLVMRISDILLAFPGFVMAAAVMAVLGLGVLNIIIALALRSLPTFARLARNMTLSLREQDYVLSARTIGAKHQRIILRHIVPNLLPSMLVLSTLRIGNAILVGASLSFLGMGVPPGTAEWGVMVKQGLPYIWVGINYLVMFPGLAIFLTVLSGNLLSDDLRDLLDPRYASEG